MYYASFGMLAIVLHIIINHDEIRKQDFAEYGVYRVKYRYFLYSILLYYVADILWGILYDIRIVPLVYADTILYFASMALSVLLWSRFVVFYLNRKDRFSTGITHSGALIFVYVLASLALNLFVPVIFSFAEDGEYIPMHARYIALGLQIVFFLVTALYAFYIAVKSSGKILRRYTTIGLSGITMAIFIVLQAIYPLIPFYAIGCLIGNCLVHSFIEVDEKIEYTLQLGAARNLAYTDPLTGVKSTHAYVEAKRAIDHDIRDGKKRDFAVVVFDINDLKIVNDTRGHDEGDLFIKTACSIICELFAHSPIYRTGGDEFMAILEGSDYENREQLLEAFELKIDDNNKKGLIVISDGLAVYRADKDGDFDAVYQRADRRMYERKNALKGYCKVF